MAAAPLPSFADFLDGLEELHREAGLQVRTAPPQTQVLRLCGDPDQVIPFLIAEGREALRRAAQGEPPADAHEAAQAHRAAQGAEHG